MHNLHKNNETVITNCFENRINKQYYEILRQTTFVKTLTFHVFYYFVGNNLTFFFIFPPL